MWSPSCSLTPSLAAVVCQNIKSDDHRAGRERVMADVFEGNGEQGHVLFGVILDEEVNDIAFSIDHVCGCQSVSQIAQDEQSVGVRTAERTVRREGTCDLEFWCWLWFSHYLSSATVWGSVHEVSLSIVNHDDTMGTTVVMVLNLSCGER